MILSLIIELLFILLFALGEEIGFRGYLLPHLQSLGSIRALLLSGFLHGCWHLPLMIFTPFYHGLGNRWLVIPLFLLTLTAAGVAYGYLRLRSGSTWPAAARAAEESEGGMVRLLGWLARLGVLRLTDIGYQQAKDLPPQQAAEYAALWATTQFWQSIQAQAADVPQLDAAVGVNHTLGDLPLIVLSADTAWLTPGAPADEARQVYTTLNLEQAAFSSNSLHRTVAGASHTSLVNKESDAQATVAAIRQVIAAIKTASPLR